MRGGEPPNPDAVNVGDDVSGGRRRGPIDGTGLARGRRGRGSEPPPASMDTAPGGPAPPAARPLVRPDEHGEVDTTRYPRAPRARSRPESRHAPGT